MRTVHERPRRSIRRLAGAALVLLVVVAGSVSETEAAKAPTRAEVVFAGLLERPKALAFNPRDGALWIVNDSRAVYDHTVVVRNVGTARQQAMRLFDGTFHYLANPLGIAFSPRLREVATAGAIGGGPTLWTSEQRRFHGSRESHLDMVHHSEMPVGIAVGADIERREYWVFNGHRGSLDRYFFNEPHELGGMNHADGVVYRYAESSLKYLRGIPGHVAFDRSADKVYVADTGGGRIAVMTAGPVPTNAKLVGGHPLPERLFEVPNTSVRTLASGLRRPSGLLLTGKRLLVGEHTTGRIVVLDLSGRRLRSINTGLGSNALTGLAADAKGRIYFLDSKRGRVLRLRAALS